MEKNDARILVIDDDENIRTLYVERLKAEGFTVESAANGEKGLARVTDFNPDVILLDIMLPKISGFSVLEILKTTKEYKNIPVIILSALTQSEDRARGVTAGATAYLTKSESLPAEVVNKVKEVLKKKKG